MTDLSELKKPFAAEELEWRVQTSGLKKNGEPWAQVFWYIQARAIQDRLDDVVGAGNWQAEFRTSEKGVICSLSILVDGEWVKKEDGSEYTEYESFKGGISGAFKRAAVHWGIGRYLYDLESGWGVVARQGTPGSKKVKVGNQYFFFLPHQLPEWALPQKKPQPAAPAQMEDDDIQEGEPVVKSQPRGSSSPVKPKSNRREVKSAVNTDLED